ncbi:testicular acid phosphatase homolog isoform X3 [Homalodisca vitripennis]|nr:testicular acid phosphatase homolog isoform X3 [Homalodisca vitripennis]
MERHWFWLYITTFTVLWGAYQLNKEPVATFHSKSFNNSIEITNSTTSNAVITKGSRASTSLQLVIAVARHGNRASDFSVAMPLCYPVNDTNTWPYGPGQLTNKGRLQMHRLGKRIRSLYDGFISQYYLPEQVMAYTKDESRLVMSAELLLAGLFPPRGYQVWNSDLLWQPVPVFRNYKEHTRRAIPVNASACPKFQRAQASSLEQYEEKYGRNVTDLVEYVQRATGINIVNDVPRNFVDHNLYRIALWFIWESIIHAVRSLTDNEGLKLPDWATRIYPDPIAHLISELTKAYATASDTQIKLFQGEIFQEIISFMQHKVEQMKAPKRFYLYTFHDGTIFGLMHILGHSNYSVVQAKTGSALIFELHRDPQSGGHYVKVVFINGATQELELSEVNIPGCDSPCDFHLLCNITEKYYNVEDWKKECENLVKEMFC